MALNELELASDAQVSAMLGESEPAAGAGVGGSGGGGGDGSEMMMAGWVDEVHTEVGMDSLNEPVLATLGRDLKRIGLKLVRVIVPVAPGQHALLLKDWDLWGPLLLCLVLSVTLSWSAPSDQSALVFALVFALVWVGALVVTLNAQLLGGELSILQSVCVLGYCIFPMLIATVFASIWSHLVWRATIVLIAWAWATFASRSFLVDSVPSNKRLLAIYPIALFYLTIAWMILVK